MFDFLKRKKEQPKRRLEYGQFPLTNPVFVHKPSGDGKSDVWWIEFDLVNPDTTIKHITIGPYGSVGAITHDA